ncbi:MAG: fused MFS/spermidine synthase [Planctomycetes bacterium]|nr:fused MFS/spermidine synthase [Planctomycetota bacterium]
MDELKVDPSDTGFLPRRVNQTVEAEGGLQNVIFLLLLLFVGSGCSALIYEIVWFQLLALVIGSSAVSLGVLLATFMGGLCIGSVLLPRLISTSPHPLVVYAALELVIGAIGLSVYYWVPPLAQLYAANAAAGFAGILMRAAFGATCLLPGAILMGATLPAIARWMESTPEGVSRLGFFYVANLMGAVSGCLLTGFYLLRVHDMQVATHVAVLINVIVALLAWAASRKLVYRRAGSPRRSVERAGRTRSARDVHLTIALSGMTALAAEVLWTRQLSLLLGATVYTFSIILAVFLLGLGIGSGFGSFLARDLRQPRRALGLCQLLAALAVAWSAYNLSDGIARWPIDPTWASGPWVVFQMDLMRCLWAIFPGTLLWGASFPLALAAAASCTNEDTGRLVGRVYAVNTIGAIAGGLGAGLVLVSWLGTQGAHRLLIAICTLAALIMLAPPMLNPRPSMNRLRRSLRYAWGWIGFAAVIGIAFLSIDSVPKVNPGIIAYGRTHYRLYENIEYLHVSEGQSASIAITQGPGGTRSLHVSGKTVASNIPDDMGVQLMLGHVPALFHQGPRSALIVGCGMGVTAGCFVLHPSIERIVICEIEANVPLAAREHFSTENNRVLDDSRTLIVHDDARHFLATTHETFDIITSDPIHPWVRGAATLYTSEYFDLCREHLNPGGIVAQWVPLYETSEDAVRTSLATFFDSWPEGSIWANSPNGRGYDLAVVGSPDPLHIDVEELERRLQRADHARVRESLEQIDRGGASFLLSTYAGRGPELAPWLAGAPLNRDSNLKLQYLAGLGVHLFQSDAIYRAILKSRTYPEDILTVPADGERSLRMLMGISQRR